MELDRLQRNLEVIVGPHRVSSRTVDLETYSRDMWPRLLLAYRDGIPTQHRPNIVVWPESVREVIAIVKLAREQRVPIVPYGGGSGVCGGAVPIRGGITIDTKRMQTLRSVRADELVCDVEAGLSGERFERELARRGYTFGHFPSSIYCSTVGGWLATRAAGQLSTKYGKVEDRVLGLTVVTGRGEAIETDGPTRALSGPNWNQLIVGSEGTLGIITSARLRVSPAPQLRVFRGYEVDNIPQGLEAIRRVLQKGLRPAVVRLYDELDTLMNAMSHHDAVDRTAPMPTFDHTAHPGDPWKSPTMSRADDPRVPLQGFPGVMRDRDAPWKSQTTTGSPRRGTGDDARLPTANAPRGASNSAGTIEPGALPAWPAAKADDKGVIDRLLGFATGKGLKGLRMPALRVALGNGELVNKLLGAVERVSRRGCRLVIGLEGARIRTEVEAALTFAELEAAGARNQGEEPGWAWLRNRYAVSYRMSPIFRSGAFVDTMEVASSWDRLIDLYHSVRTAIGRHAVVMAHFSHAYADGCSIYFTFAAHAPEAAGAERLYDAIWRDGLDAAIRAGGTISHHHGIGLLKAPYMLAEHREAMAIFAAAKASLDPDGVFNPGKMGLH